jgi:hypothetical protein
MPAAPQGSPEIVVLKVDREHSRVHAPRGVKPPAYVLAPVEGIILDLTGFRLSDEGRPETRPNLVELIVEGRTDNFIYRTAWQDSRRIEMTPATLQPQPGSPPFTGFKAGDSAYVTIGYERVDPQTSHSSISVMWMAGIEIR